MHTPYRWVILALVTLTATTVSAAPMMALPVLFKEIATDLHMDLVQVGLITTVTSLMSVCISVFGGALGDRLGPRRAIVAACIAAGVTGGLRALSTSFETLVLTTVFFGLTVPVVGISQSKLCAVWFAPRERGTANGLLSVGMALGFLLGALLSATVLSPLLGGWRAVLAGYGALAIAIGGTWLVTRDPPGGEQDAPRISVREGLRHVVARRNMWAMGFAGVGYGGAVTAMLAYLPLYLRGIGWQPAQADGTIASFHAISMLGAVPIAMLSDRLGKRRIFLLIAALLMASSIGGLAYAAGAAIVAAVLLAGMMRDAFMGIFFTTVMEIRGIGATYTGSAVGFLYIFFGTGSMLSPPLGNSLAAFGAGVPFLFWAGMVGLAFVSLLFLDPKGLEQHR